MWSIGKAVQWCVWRWLQERCYSGALPAVEVGNSFPAVMGRWGGSLGCSLCRAQSTNRLLVYKSWAERLPEVQAERSSSCWVQGSSCALLTASIARWHSLGLGHLPLISLLEQQEWKTPFSILLFLVFLQQKRAPKSLHMDHLHSLFLCCLRFELICRAQGGFSPFFPFFSFFSNLFSVCL